MNQIRGPFYNRVHQGLGQVGEDNLSCVVFYRLDGAGESQRTIRSTSTGHRHEDASTDRRHFLVFHC